MKILYLVHDLSDPSVHKRVVMLLDGGAEVVVAGFCREQGKRDNIAGCITISLGQTHNGRFVQRLWSVIREMLCLSRHKEMFIQPDVIIARNLELLAIAVRGQSIAAKAIPLVYECLDIHRLLLGKGITGSAFRRMESALAKRAAALITSSPAFVREYFNTISRVHLPIRIVENKVYDPDHALHKSFSHRELGAPWKIGWFGAIRCRKSLQILTDLVRQSNGKVEVIIRGRPALDQFDDFHKTVTETPGLQFLGPYKNPDELESIYRSVHFTWAIDMFEEGLNSSWLLPNRLYEGGVYASVPIAEASVETGRFIDRLGIGITLCDPKTLSLLSFFKELTPEKYEKLEKAAMNIPRETWVYDRSDCQSLIAYLGSLKR